MNRELRRRLEKLFGKNFILMILPKEKKFYISKTIRYTYPELKIYDKS